MDSNFRYRGRRPASGRSLRAQRVETDAAKREFRIRQLLVCAALGREWWARRRAVLSVSDPRERAAKRAGWRRSGAIFAFFGAVCFEPDASRARLRFKAVMRSMTGGGAAISLGLTVSPFILASISSCKASW